MLVVVLPVRLRLVEGCTSCVLSPVGVVPWEGRVRVDVGYTVPELYPGVHDVLLATPS